MQFSYSSIFVSGSNQVTLTDVSDLVTSLFVYGIPVIAGTKIQSIDTTHNTITMTSNAVSNFTGVVVYSDMTPEKYVEQCEAMKEVQRIINSQGQMIQIIIRKDSEVHKDDYGSIIGRPAVPPTVWSLKAFPVKFNASRELKETLGFCDDTETIVYTSHKDWIDNSYDYELLDQIRSTVNIDERTYKIREKTKYGNFSNNYLYILLGLTTK